MNDQGDGTESDDKESDQSHTTSKVGRVLVEYDLDGLGQTMEARWTGNSEERYSLRELADWLNKHLLEVAMTRAGRQPIDGEVDNVYRLLTGDDVSSGVRTQARNDLKRDGVAIDKLERDFVSHQAVHTYLTKYRGARHSAPATDDNDRIESVTQAIQRLSHRTLRVTEDNLSTLENTDRLKIGDFDVLVDVTVTCQDCGTRYSVVELLERGHCDCVSTDDNTVESLD
ncbi:rod-determining factor RdfA [Halocatena salina]|uniref:Uncharacterized protein n=1 Tax=Halocatena salina TaxID=2934340 RepID=A0A8T9ZZZ6_9EURY|nr:rod-determining factor RdfA [Halocatena salina]UPM42136.1 hypothetical protein MW046_09190 [Halocatena salina]